MNTHKGTQTQRHNNSLHIDPENGHQWVIAERRQAHGPLLPALYLFLEFTLVLLLVVSVGLFQIGWLTGIMLLVGVYYLIISCLPRYREAVERQKYYT